MQCTPDIISSRTHSNTAKSIIWATIKDLVYWFLAIPTEYCSFGILPNWHIIFYDVYFRLYYTIFFFSDPPALSFRSLCHSAIPFKCHRKLNAIYHFIYTFRNSATFHLLQLPFISGNINRERKNRASYFNVPFIHREFRHHGYIQREGEMGDVAEYR